jgi:peptide/nickel transport system substrate-binding protein
MSKDTFEDLHRRALETPMSRRRLFGVGAGAVSAAILAGAPIPGGLGRVVMAQGGGAEFHSAWPYETPPTGHFNSLVAHGIMQLPNIYGDLIMLPMGLYYWGTQEWLPILATKWGFAKDGENFTVTLQQGVKWSDGTDFTSKDVVATFNCLRIMSNTVWEYIDKVTADDDYNLTFHMSTPSTVVERYVIRQSPLASSVYGEWSDRAAKLFDGGKTIDDPEGKKLLDEFNNFRPEGFVANGPFNLDVNSITSSNLNLVKNETGYLADKVLFDKIVNYNGETDTISAVVLSGDVDYATHGFAPATEKEMQAQGIRILRPPVYSGPALLINFAKFKDTLGNEKVRQAIAHAVDRAQNGTVALAESGIGVKYMTGMSDNLVPNWINQDAVSSLNQYEYDQDKATSLLEEAGWKKDGDTWTMNDGKPAKFELEFPAEFADWSAAGQDLAEQLTNFGITVEPRAVTYTQVPIDVDKGNFELAIQGWGSSTNPHPHFSFVTDLFTNNTLAKNQGGKGIDFPLKQTTQVAGDVDLNKLVVDSALGLDEQKQKDNVTTIAQVFNELLPKIPLFERYGNNAALEGKRVDKWPADDDPILKNSPYADGIPTMLMLTGKLKPVGSA